jgi:nicotinate phosphoribosyltransferase
MNPIPSQEEIRRGDTTDVYFARTREVLKKLGKEKVRVTAEAYVKRFPDDYEHAILAGMDEMLSLLAGRNVDVWGMAEGSLFLCEEPVFSVEGSYGEFCEMETAMLGILCQASGIATKTSRIKRLAGDRTVLSFGARRMHPALSTIIDRHAFLGGADGVSVVRSALFLGETPQGTMPHALILVLGDTVEALRGFHSAVDADVPRVCLIDTLQDEKFEALRAARGDFRKILREVRWELDLRGFSHVRILVSGGLGEEDIVSLRDVVDGFGVGTCISNAPTIDFALDIVEVEGRPFAKRGKLSGGKQVVQCGSCGNRAVVPEARASDPCHCGSRSVPLLLPAMKGGEVLTPALSPRELRSRVMGQVEKFHAGGNRR